MDVDIVSMVGAHADGPGPWFPLVWIAVVIVFWAGVFLVARRFWWRGGCGPGGSAHAALADRYARGELTEDEYRRARDVLDERRPRS
jgi:putative membrane protein